MFWDLEIIKVMVNVGLFVLIWMVQLVVYPSFRYFSETDIKSWHPIYTKNITYIVFPLMLIQFLLYVFTVVQSPGLMSIVALALVFSIWMITIFMAVPLHHKIDQEKKSVEARLQLIKINWLRTVIWSIILIISLLSYGK